MSIVSLLNVTVLNNPARFMDPYEFEITFECLEPLQEDLEWKLVYVGASKSSKYDQELDSLLVGPVPQGVNRFVFQTDPPKPDLIPQDQLVSITVMLLSCAYRGREFVQVGYYVNNEYDNDELRENPPSRVALDHVVRNILAEKPRVTKYNIPWDSEQGEEYPPEQPDVDGDADEDNYGNEEEDLRDEMIDELEADDVEVEDDSEDDGGDDDDDQDKPSGADGADGAESVANESVGESAGEAGQAKKEKVSATEPDTTDVKVEPAREPDIAEPELAEPADAEEN